MRTEESRCLLTIACLLLYMPCPCFTATISRDVFVLIRHGERGSVASSGPGGLCTSSSARLALGYHMHAVSMLVTWISPSHEHGALRPRLRKRLRAYDNGLQDALRHAMHTHEICTRERGTSTRYSVLITCYLQVCTSCSLLPRGRHGLSSTRIRRVDTGRNRRGLLRDRL